MTYSAGRTAQVLGMAWNQRAGDTEGVCLGALLGSGFAQESRRKRGKGRVAMEGDGKPENCSHGIF